MKFPLTYETRMVVIAVDGQLPKPKKEWLVTATRNLEQAECVKNGARCALETARIHGGRLPPIRVFIVPDCYESMPDGPVKSAVRNLVSMFVARAMSEVH